MAAGRASHAGKAKVQIPAIHITVNHLPDIRPEKPVLALIAFFPDHFQIFEVILDALKVAGVLGVSGRVGIISGFCGRLEHSGNLRQIKINESVMAGGTNVNINVKHM